MSDHLLVASRQEHQLDRLGNRRLGRHVNECSVAHERGIERGERPVLRCGVLGEMLANEILPMRDDVGETLNVVKKRRRKRALKKTVNKDEPVSGFEHEKPADLFERRNPRRRFRQIEGALGDRRDAGEAPRLLLHVRKTEIVKAGDAAFAQILQPIWSARRAVRGPGPVRSYQLFYMRHRHDTMAASRSQS
ncbi:MAG: hypothetical protein DMD66_04655 [Gemmatimonadetes bacterium]|nr:MAG: hypothetical protein DMD66_04655 [Gemmatimonadota bacterium]